MSEQVNKWQWASEKMSEQISEWEGEELMSLEISESAGEWKSEQMTESASEWMSK